MNGKKLNNYENVIGDNLLYVSHGGHCLTYKTSESGLEINTPADFQGKHEEADTLLARHARLLCGKSMLVRSSDTDVLIILIALVGRLSMNDVFMDFGAGNTRRYINISGIAEALNNKTPNITEALLGFHALTGCDYTSSFHRKGKIQPFKRLESQNEHVGPMCTLSTNDVDESGIVKYVASLYRCDTSDIDEARYTSFIRMTTGSSDHVIEQIKRCNCASLPPCTNSLRKHIKIANYVAKMWKRAAEQDPTEGENPLNYGWELGEDGLQPEWFDGKQLPDSITEDEENGDTGPINDSTNDNESEDSDVAWNEEDSDDDSEDLLI